MTSTSDHRHNGNDNHNKNDEEIDSGKSIVLYLKSEEFIFYNSI